MTEGKMKEILSRETKIPQNVNEKIQATYDLLDEAPQKYHGMNQIGHRKIYAAAVILFIFSIFTAMNWEKVYVFAESIFVNQESNMNGEKLELPKVSYIQGKFPTNPDFESSNTGICQKYYGKMTEVEKDFGIKFLKNKLAKNEARGSKGIMVLYNNNKSENYTTFSEYYWGDVTLNNSFYIVEEIDEITYSEDGQEANWNSQENSVMLDLSITCYIDTKNTKKNASYSEDREDVSELNYYEDETMGTVAIWSENDTKHARFVYKDMIYELSGEASWEKLKEAVAAFYE